jgi:hypothetical protein
MDLVYFTPLLVHACKQGLFIHLDLQLWKTICSGIFAKTCKIAKSALPFGYFAMLTYQFAQSVLPNCKVHIAKLPSPLHPVDCRPEFQGAHKMFLFLSCPIPELFSGLPICLPQKIRLPLILNFFSHAA